jgi:hypothetical protein
MSNDDARVYLALVNNFESELRRLGATDKFVIQALKHVLAVTHSEEYSPSLSKKLLDSSLKVIVDFHIE